VAAESKPFRGVCKAVNECKYKNLVFKEELDQWFIRVESDFEAVQ